MAVIVLLPAINIGQLHLAQHKVFKVYLLYLFLFLDASYLPVGQLGLVGSARDPRVNARVWCFLVVIVEQALVVALS